MSAILASLLPNILPVIGSIVLGLLGWAAAAIARRNAAATAESKAIQAGLKLAAIAVAMAGRAWDSLGPKVQAAFADGKMSPEERTEIEAAVQTLIKDFTSADDLEQIGKALGLPLPGIIAKVASIVIEKFAFAHDPGIPTASPLQYPVNTGVTLTQGSAPDPTQG